MLACLRGRDGRDRRTDDVQFMSGPAAASTWYTETAVAAPERAPLTGDLDVDVCVIGAGLAGLTAARELARRNWSVAVLETHDVGSAASGRNMGFVLPGFACDMEDVVKRVGLDDARALWALAQAGLDYVRAAIDETGMPGVDPVEAGWLKVAKSDNADADLATVRLVGQEFGGSIEGWPVERVRAVLRSEHYFHAVFMPQAFHIHPLNYARGLAAAAETAGARIFTGTPAVSIDATGVRKRIATAHGRLRADHVVLAGNVHLGKLVPRVAGTLTPVWTYVMVTKPLGERLAAAIGFAGAVSDTELADNHYRIVGGDRLMWSGRATTWPRDPRRLARALQADLAEVYPQLADVEIEHVWSGVLGNALHRMPQVGELASRIWLASGFGGHGLNTTAMAGTVIARAIAEGDDTWRRFVPFELVWSGGLVGRAAAQVHYWWYRYHERSRGKQARRREAEYRRST
ncbi:MAG: FAD-binding oxidoreductase [Hyphomicrobiales bacterium]|nr:FAD-binding oxidoreductase [Hyphomicrobiales bacterium]